MERKSEKKSNCLPQKKRCVRIGSDRIGSDRIGSDRREGWHLDKSTGVSKINPHLYCLPVILTLQLVKAKHILFCIIQLALFLYVARLNYCSFFFEQRRNRTSLGQLQTNSFTENHHYHSVICPTYCWIFFFSFFLIIYRFI